MRRLAVALALLALADIRPAAALTESALATVGATPRIGALLPLGLGFRDDAGRRTTLGQALGGKPAILVFADYRCSSLCGPGLVLTSLALDQAGLKPGRDYRYVVLGLDQEDPPAVAAAVRRGRLNSPAGRRAILLGGGPADQVARAAGFRYLFDPAVGQYVHDTVVYALAPDGRVRAALSEFTLSPAELRAALSSGPAPELTLLSRIRLLCHGLVADAGRWNGVVLAGLRLGGIVILLLFGLGAAVALSGRRRRT
jgi:protein SCO1/2